MALANKPPVPLGLFYPKINAGSLTPCFVQAKDTYFCVITHISAKTAAPGALIDHQ